MGTVKKLKTHKIDKVSHSLTRFSYRYRLACSFSSMVIDGTTPLTQKGYTAFLKLFLAYSAYDEVRAAEMVLLKRETLKVHNIKDQPVLAATLRKNVRLKNLLLGDLEDMQGSLKKMVKIFYEGDTDDIMCIATAARNSFVHGDLTAGGAGLSITPSVTAIDDLAKVLREYSDKLFSKCLKRIEDKEESNR